MLNTFCFGIDNAADEFVVCSLENCLFMSIFRQICVNYSNWLPTTYRQWGNYSFTHLFFVDKFIRIGELLEILTEMVEEKFLEYIQHTN